MFYSYPWRRYVPVSRRRSNAAREIAKLKKQGQPVSPVVVEGRVIARTFWGKAWCENLEHYSDYENRLPRGRTYVRNGSVLDLRIGPGAVQALVSGSEIYKVTVKVTPVPKVRWTSICKDCAGAVDSLVELLQGRLSDAVMERICRQKTGLFPAPAEIELTCSCPDWASMCKHVAAVLYGIGRRLDDRPELLFELRGVDEKQLIAKAGTGLPVSKKPAAKGRVLAAGDLSEIFGLAMAEDPPSKARRARAAGEASVRRKLVKGKNPANRAAEAKSAKKR